MNGKSFLAVSAALAAAVASADFDPKAATTLTHTGNDDTFVSAVTNASRWAAKSGSGVTAVAPCLPDGSPNPDAAGFDYYSTHTMRTFKAGSSGGITYPDFKGEAHWGGRSLHFGSGGNFQYAGAYPTQRLRIDDLHFHENSQMSLNANIGLTNSTITIESTHDQPFYFDVNCGSSDSSPAYCRWQDCTLKGGKDSVIWLRTALASNSHQCGVLFAFSGVADEFYGTFEIGACDYRDFSQTAKYHQRNTTYKAFNGARMPNATFNLHPFGNIKTDSTAPALVGTVNMRGGTFGEILNYPLTIKQMNVYTNSVVASFTTGNIIAEELNLYCGEATIATNLAQTVGTVGGLGAAQFYYYYNLDDHRHGVVNVTNKIEGVVELSLQNPFLTDVVLNDYTNETTLLTYPLERGAITEADFNLIYSQTLYGGLPRLSLRVDVEDGLQKVKLVRSGVVRLDQKTTKSGSKFFSDGSFWSDGRIPHNDADYLVASTNSFYPQESVKDLTAYMRSLTLGNGREMWLYNTITYPDLSLYGKASIVGSSSFALSGSRLNIPEGQVGSMRPYGGATFTVNIPLVGGGTLQTLNRGKADPYGTGYVNFGNSTLYLTKECPDFTGTIYMTSYAAGFYPYEINESTKLKIAKPLSLGAPRKEYTYDALRISEYGCLQPAESMTLDDATRGIYFDNYGRFLVDAGITLKVNERLTFNGTCEKCGAGTLWLGADVAPKFTDKQSDDPVEGKNVLVVTNGALGVTSKVAVEGLAVRFAEGTRIAVNANATGDAAKFGLYSKTGSVAFDGDALKVAFVPPADEQTEVAVAVLTVPTDRAEAFAGKLVAEKAKGYAVTFSSAVTPGEEGMTTFTATLTHSGFMIFVK